MKRDSLSYVAVAPARRLQRWYSGAAVVAAVLVTPHPPGAQEEIAPYCSALKHVVALAMGKERFESIAGKPGEGNFVESRLVLPSWDKCWLYGATTYTCDSQSSATAQQAEQAQARILGELQACLGEPWREAKHRSSPSYVVLHHLERPISITLSTDQTDTRQQLVRLIMFVRKN